MHTVTEKLYTSAEACDLAGISYRQLDWWCRIGTVEPWKAACGSGSRRGWTRQQIAVLAVLARVGGHIHVGRLAQLVAVLADWPVATWRSDTVLLVDVTGEVWSGDDTAGVPAVTTAVNLGAIAAELALRRVA